MEIIHARMLSASATPTVSSQKTIIGPSRVFANRQPSRMAAPAPWRPWTADCTISGAKMP